MPEIKFNGFSDFVPEDNTLDKNWYDLEITKTAITKNGSLQINFTVTGGPAQKATGEEPGRITIPVFIDTSIDRENWMIKRDKKNLAMILNAIGEEQSDEMDTDDWVGKTLQGLVSSKADSYGVPRLQIERFREDM